MIIVHYLNMAISIGYYLVALFFLVAIIKSFIKCKDVQESILYALITIPFVLRILRLK